MWSWICARTISRLHSIPCEFFWSCLADFPSIFHLCSFDPYLFSLHFLADVSAFGINEAVPGMRYLGMGYDAVTDEYRVLPIVALNFTGSNNNSCDFQVCFILPLSAIYLILQCIEYVYVNIWDREVTFKDDKKTLTSWVSDGSAVKSWTIPIAFIFPFISFVPLSDLISLCGILRVVPRITYRAGVTLSTAIAPTLSLRVFWDLFLILLLTRPIRIVS